MKLKKPSKKTPRPPQRVRPFLDHRRLHEKMRNMKPNDKGVFLRRDPDLPVAMFQQRINVAVSKGPAAPAGYRFTKRATDSGGAKIYLIREQ